MKKPKRHCPTLKTKRTKTRSRSWQPKASPVSMVHQERHPGSQSPASGDPAKLNRAGIERTTGTADAAGYPANSPFTFLTDLLFVCTGTEPLAATPPRLQHQTRNPQPRVKTGRLTGNTAPLTLAGRTPMVPCQGTTVLHPGEKWMFKPPGKLARCRPHRHARQLVALPVRHKQVATPDISRTKTLSCSNSLFANMYCRVCEMSWPHSLYCCRKKQRFALRERPQHCICFVRLHLKCENTSAFAFRASAALRSATRGRLKYPG